jgi:hypothetical protein
MCTTNARGFLRFGIREWVGIFSIVLALSAISSGVTVMAVKNMVDVHTSDTQRHENDKEKTARIYRILDREIDTQAITQLSANVAVLSEQVQTLSRQLERLENRGGG